MLNIIYITIDYFNCKNESLHYSLQTNRNGYIINFFIKNVKITILLEDSRIKEIKLNNVKIINIFHKISYNDEKYSISIPKIYNLNIETFKLCYKLNNNYLTLIDNVNCILDIHKKYENILIHKILLQKIIDRYTTQSMDYLFEYLVS